MGRSVRQALSYYRFAGKVECGKRCPSSRLATWAGLSPAANQKLFWPTFFCHLERVWWHRGSDRWPRSCHDYSSRCESLCLRGLSHWTLPSAGYSCCYFSSITKFLSLQCLKNYSNFEPTPTRISRQYATSYSCWGSCCRLLKCCSSCRDTPLTGWML